MNYNNVTNCKVCEKTIGNKSHRHALRCGISKLRKALARKTIEVPNGTNNRH